MGRRFISPFARTLLLLLFLCPISMASFHFKALESASTSFRSPAGRSLLSLSHTALIAALDGTIHLVDTHSDRVIWSFASGPPIYSSYHQPFDDTHDSSSAFYIDCGHDWDLYMHTPYLGTTKLPVSIEDLIKSTPFLSADGAVTLGSKNTTVFEVDPKLGRLMRTYTSSDSPSALKSAEDDNAYASATASDTELVRSDSNAKLRLQIIRTDYALKSFAPNSDEVSWNMTVAEIVAALFCPGVDNPSGADPLNSKDMLGGGDDIALPLPCQSKAFVFRHRTVRPEGLTRVGDQENSKDGMRPLPPLKSNGSGLENDQNGRFQHHGNELSNVFGWSSALCLALSAGVLLGIVLYRFALSFKVKLVLQEQTKNCNSKASCSKRKKNRKLEKNNGVVDEKNKQVSSDDQDVEGTWLHLNKRFDCGAEGWRRIGKLVVSTTEIAKGSNGTVVLEGIHEGRRVAVKRLVQAHHDVAFKEIQNLIASDSHPNIVRWYGVEYDQDFVYLSLERCTCSLDDLVQIYSFSPQNPSFGKHNATTASMEYKVRLESMKNIVPKVNLWKANGQPSLLLLKLMRDIVSGLAHLHELGILHRDLKPQNVLISTERSLCAKLSDMGISKRLIGDVSSLGRHATGCGTSGWQAPEQLLQGRQTRAVDLFSLGCILFFCITGGRHPFGDRLERDINIVKNHMDLFLVECIPEAIDLISRLLNPDPELRLKASNVLDHPLFWDSETRLSFLRDTSDRVELEDRESSSGLLKALEGIAPIALGAKWDEKMEPAFIANIGHYRRYKFDSVRDLLRVMRNKLNHYRELPKEIQDLVGTVPEGFDGYFASRFPRLLIEVYKVIYSYCKEEECFQKYYRSNAE